MFEASWRKDKLALYGRYGFVQKSAGELVLNETAYGNNIFPVAFTAGFNYDLLQIGKTVLAGGSQFTYKYAGNKLNALYGKNPMAFEVFLRLYPALMKM